jgi:hypothetical protein
MNLHLLVLKWNMTGVAKHIGDIEFLHGQSHILARQEITFAVTHNLAGLLDDFVHFVRNRGE